MKQIKKINITNYFIMSPQIPEKYLELFKYLENSSQNFEIIVKDFLKISKQGREIYLKDLEQVVKIQKENNQS